MKVYGDYHTHTVFSDGRNTVDENVVAAKQCGLSAVAITDHSHHQPHNTKKRREKLLLAKAQTVKAGKEHGIQTLFGVECNIVGPHGTVDIPDDERKYYDIIVCGIHPSIRSRNVWHFFTYYLPNVFWMCLRYLGIKWAPKHRIRKNTRAVVNAVEKHNIDVLSHPGRYFPVNVIEIAKACVARGTAMELNNKRISFRPIDFERMAAMGVKFIIGSDAHKAENVGKMERVGEFLKLCEYNPDCLLNVDRPFVRPKAQILQQIVEADHGSQQV